MPCTALAVEHHTKKAFLHKHALTGFTEWHKLVTEPPFKLGKLFVRQPRGGIMVNPEDKQRLTEQRAAEIAKRRADFNAASN